MHPSEPSKPVASVESIVSTSRWRALCAFIERWYESPLAQGDGCSLEEVQAAEERLRVRFPTALSEWFQLLGRRIQPIQDTPPVLETLRVRDSFIEIWTENQGCWNILSPIQGEDPPVHVVPASEGRAGSVYRLSEMLTGMLLSETLIGSWQGTGIGALGTFSKSVTGGNASDGVADEILDSLVTAYPELPWASHPFYSSPYRGNDNTVVRIEGSFVEWMVCTNEAYTSFSSVLPLEPPNGTYYLSVLFEGLNEETERWLASDAHPERLDGRNVQAALGTLGHVRMVRRWAATAELEISTFDPRAAWIVVAHTLSAGALARTKAAFRPGAVARFTPLHPHGLCAFHLPR